MSRGSRGRPRERNGNFKRGRFTRETRELRGMVRKMARDAETLLATALSAHGLKPTQLRRRSHVKKALAEIHGQSAPNPPMCSKKSSRS
jgi:hypothetical protein